MSASFLVRICLNLFLCESVGVYYGQPIGVVVTISRVGYEWIGDWNDEYREIGW